MRVLFATYSEKTHFLAMVPIAWALRAAGHEVRVATQPALIDTVTTTGLTAVPVGTDHNMARVSSRILNKGFASRNPELYERVRWGRMPPFDLPTQDSDITWSYLKAGYHEVVPGYRMANEPMADDLVAFCRAWQPDLVIWEPATYSAPIAAAACGAAHARLLWSLDFFGRMRAHFRRLRPTQPASDQGDALTEWLSTKAAKYGVPFNEEMTTGQFTIDQLPPSLRYPTGLHHVPVRYVPYNHTAVVPDWLWHKPSRPRVVLTLGISATERFGGYAVSVQDILNSLADLDIELVATVAQQEQDKLTHIPANTRVVAFVPLHALVPSCSVVIHAAGFGTLCTTLKYGVPQLCLPEQQDTLISTRLVAEQGAAIVIPSNEVTGEGVRDQVIRLLSEPSFRTAATHLSDEMAAMPSPNDVVPELEALTRKHRSATTTTTAIAG
jgi:glycosyltransferase (activator-dependent family)